METFSALLDLCAGNSPVTGEFPAQRPVTRSYVVFFDLGLNKRLGKHTWGCWFETPSRSPWRHCNGVVMLEIIKIWRYFEHLMVYMQIWMIVSMFVRCNMHTISILNLIVGSAFFYHAFVIFCINLIHGQSCNHFWLNIATLHVGLGSKIQIFVPWQEKTTH